MRQCRNFAGVLQRNAKTPGSRLQIQRLLACKMNSFPSDSACRQIGNNPVAHAGVRIINSRQLESFENTQKNGCARNNNLRAPWSDSVNPSAFQQVERGNGLEKLSDLRRSGSQAGNIVASNPWNAINCGYDCRR